MSSWSAESYEDQLLKTYHNEVGGRVYTEVAVPYRRGYKEWPDGYSNRYIDAIRINEPFHEEGIVPFANHGVEVLHVTEAASVEIIEIKRSLNRPVIGQILAGCDLFEATYAPADIQPIALCNSSEPALEWVCEQREIEVRIVEPTSPLKTGEESEGVRWKNGERQ